MRVAHVITRMIVGGAQENTLFNCRDLVEMYGDEVLLITGPALGPEGDLLAKQEIGQVQVRYVDALRRSIHPVRDWLSYRHVKRMLAEFRPDVVHTHSAKGGILGRVAASRLKVPAIVHTVHGAPFHEYQHPLTYQVYRACETYAAKRCQALISVADAMTDRLVAAGVAPREKFVTIYSGMDVEPFRMSGSLRAATRRDCGFRDEEIVIGKIARLFPLKGHHDLIASAEAVVRACPQVRFLLVGDGVLRQTLEREIEGRGLQPYFRFTGLVAPDEIPALISAMDVLVHTSLREGLARALPQALLAGKPVVSYDIDGAREVVLEGETGCLIPARDQTRLSQALVRLAGDAELRQRLGREGQRRFTDLFRHETMTRQIRELYQALLQRPT